MEHVLKLTDGQLGLVGAGLAELPFKLAQPVMAAIQQQIDAAAREAAEQQAKNATEEA